jgi:putative Mg2+ transporter-C (MgtC) family protein
MMMDISFLDWRLLGSHLLAMTIAYVLALPVAWDREQAERSAGLRTFPLVAVASCGYVLLAKNVLGGSPDSQARIIQGLITGIGFIGGGAILKEGTTVHGTATAASIWNTGAIGAAVAYGRYEIAVVLSLLNFVTLRWLKPLKRNPPTANDE